MRTLSLHIVGLLVSLACAAQAQIPAELRDFLNADAIKKLEAGQVVQQRKGFKDAQGRNCAQGRGAILIAKAPDAIWKHLIANDKYREFIPHAVSAEKYSEQGNEIGWKETTKVVFGKISYHIIQTRDESSHVLSWRLDKTRENGIRDTQGSWSLISHGPDKTILVYAARIDSGMMVPTFAENFFLNRSLPDLLEAVKKRAESDGAYKR